VTGYFSEGICGYYPERLTRNHCFSDDTHSLSQAQLTRVLAKGYRRFGVDYYRPYCRACRECTPYRVLVHEFRMTRRFRRTLKRNADLAIRWAKPRPSREKFDLYLRYQLTRHKEWDALSEQGMKRALAETMIQQMYMNPEDSIELTILLDNRVIGFAVFDRTLDSLSAVYSVFDPQAKARSLGTLNILLAIERTRELQLPYLNLGLYLAGHEKMSYKANFQPAEIYHHHQWRKFQRETT